MKGIAVSDIAPTKPVARKEYYSEGERWESAVYRTVEWSRNAWRAMAIVEAGCLMASCAALAMLVPLKSFEVVTLMVDKTTGFVEVARPLEPDGPLTRNEAVTKANIVRFVRARETYDPKGLRDNFDMASLYSSGAASKDLSNEFATSNPNNPVRKYGPDTAIGVFVKSVIFLNERTAAVRFETTLKSERETGRVGHWVANVRFKYTSEPVRMDYRFDNPLGFQVFEYRRDQEALGAAAEAGQ